MQFYLAKRSTRLKGLESRGLSLGALGNQQNHSASTLLISRIKVYLGYKSGITKKWRMVKGANQIM
jgi:hypothetical protein